jgi:hypothetical protein
MVSCVCSDYDIFGDSVSISVASATARTLMSDCRGIILVERDQTDRGVVRMTDEWSASMTQEDLCPPGGGKHSTVTPRTCVWDMVAISKARSSNPSSVPRGGSASTSKVHVMMITLVSRQYTVLSLDLYVMVLA